MDIVYDDLLEDEIVRKIQEQDGDRPEGIHVSDLLYCLDKAYYVRKLGQRELPLSTLLLFTQGRAIQDYLTGEKGDEEPILLDGVWMTVDYARGLREADVSLPWEVKMTYMSSGKEPSDGWIKQMMAYCKALGVLEYGLVRYSLMGDWSWVYKRKDRAINDEHPVLVCQRFTFTQEEIDENWAWLQDRKEVLLTALDSDMLPSMLIPDFMSGDSRWQCEKCLYRKECVVC